MCKPQIVSVARVLGLVSADGTRTRSETFEGWQL